MKNYFKLALLLITVIVLASGCEGKINQTAIPNSKDTTDSEKFNAEVMVAGDFILAAPNQTSKEYKGSDKVSVNLTDCLVTDLRGEEISGKELKAGDIIEITYDGVMMESYPAQIRASAVRVTDHNILIDAYLAIIDDIWQEDTGLNYGIDSIAMDTTGWIELNAHQKETILTKLKAEYEMEIIEGTFDELEEKGLIDKDQLLFSNGVLIVINDMKYDKEKKQLTYSVQKWRGGDGAVGSNDCTATWSDKEWKIKKGSTWIS